MKTAAIIIFCFSPFIAFAQVHIYNSNLTDTSRLVLFDHYNDIVIESNLPGEISLRTTGSNIEWQQENKFRLRPRYYSETDTLKVYVNNELVAIKPVSIELLPDIAAGIGNNADTVLTRGQLLADPFLKAIYRGSVYRSNVAITSFEMSGVTKDGDDFMVYAPGNMFTPEQIEILKNLSPGSKILFTRIRALGPDSRVRLLKPFTLTIR